MRALGIIPDGALLIVDGVIQQVGTSRRVEKLAAARDAEEIDASGKVVMPGFVDCQTHLLSPPAPLDAFEARCLEGVRVGRRRVKSIYGSCADIRRSG
jgi:imidazolonepropionase